MTRTPHRQYSLSWIDQGLLLLPSQLDHWPFSTMILLLQTQSGLLLQKKKKTGQQGEAPSEVQAPLQIQISWVGPESLAEETHRTEVWVASSSQVACRVFLPSMTG